MAGRCARTRRTTRRVGGPPTAALRRSAPNLHRNRPPRPHRAGTLRGVGAPLICVIEDEEVIAGAVAARLRAEGFAVEVAADGLAGVALCIWTYELHFHFVDYY